MWFEGHWEEYCNKKVSSSLLHGFFNTQLISDVQGVPGSLLQASGLDPLAYCLHWHFGCMVY